MDHRHRHVVFGEVGVDPQHLHRFVDRFLARGVGGVSFLPEEFGRAQEQPRPHFPADDVGPLVDQDRQVAIRLDPAGVGGADDRFAGRPHDQRFFERTGGNQPAVGTGFESMVRDDRTFLGKALDMFRLFFQEAHRNEQRKVGIFVSRLLEHAVQHALHVFPEA